MRSLVLLLAATPLLAQSRPMTPSTSAGPIVIRADRIIDGRGKIISGGAVVVNGDKITAVETAPTGVPTYDLKGMTLLPGLIDAHSHLTWYFNRQGRYHTRGDGDTPVE